MPRFLIETSHTASTCTLIVGEVHAMGYLHQFEWGCGVDVHFEWAMIEAKSEEEALLTVPLIVRPQARAVRLIKFTKEDFEQKHPSSVTTVSGDTP